MIALAGHAVYSPQRGRGEVKHNWMGKEGYAAAQNFNRKWNSEFWKKEELDERIQFIV